ncbi:NADH-quinone oxidoreductase subunit G [Smaragdicoccus niigatensis]|uniref:NADH-quinone oxidoreductase subunit G n=1 Tax=Smaragdicoccus niigatensis TaxID=359359 RepID=UPI0003615A39|nr:NADH-quinone oxidoreductase subunit G [Smaragdicoccus niigatensis]
MTSSAREKTETELVTLTIDGHEISVPKGTLVIRAAELMGTQIPRFCDHPLLDPVGACRQCLVEVEGQRKPVASCTIPVIPGMVVHTQFSSAAAEKAQKGVMELLLINHPLDCPVCDKGGECPLQNQAMSNGQADTRFTDTKRTFPKPIPISSQILLDRERCVLCARCTRFSNQIAGDPFIELLERGALQQVGIYSEEPFNSYFSGNTVQICPVGALTGAQYRFRARPFDLVSTPTVCEHCASGCAQRTDHRRGKLMRRLAGDDPEVNEEWNCDKGRWAFQYADVGDRITTPLIKGKPASWAEALRVAAEGLKTSNPAVLTGGRLTLEDSYAYSKFARVVLGTNNIDFRARPSSDEEADFLAAQVAGRFDLTYADLERADSAFLADFEPEEESPIVFLRLRKAVRQHGLKVVTNAPFLSEGARKLGAVRGTDGSIVLAGERLAQSPGALSALVGRRTAWIPRRAGERGALEAGCLPNLLPGGRPLANPWARRQVEDLWGVDIPAEPGSVDLGKATSVLCAGVELGDLADPKGTYRALQAAPFVVSVEMRHSAITEIADVVFPIVPVAEKSGTFLNWEGRRREFGTVLHSTGLTDLRVLNALAPELGLTSVDSARAELGQLGLWDGDFASPPTVPIASTDGLRLSTWRLLLDKGRLQDGEPNLAETARKAVARLSAHTAASIGAEHGDPISIGTDSGRITLKLAVTDMPDDVVWIPENSAGCAVRYQLGPIENLRIEVI